MTARKLKVGSYGVAADRARKELLPFVRKNVDAIEGEQEVGFRLEMQKARDTPIWVNTVKCTPGDDPERVTDEILQIAIDDVERWLDMGFAGRIVYNVRLSNEEDGERVQFPITANPRSAVPGEVSSGFHPDPQGMIAAAMDGQATFARMMVDQVNARVEETDRRTRDAHERADRAEVMKMQWFQAMQVALSTDQERRILLQRSEDERANRELVGKGFAALIPTAAGLLGGPAAAELTSGMVSMLSGKGSGEAPAEVAKLDALFGAVDSNPQFADRLRDVLEASPPDVRMLFMNLYLESTARRSRAAMPPGPGGAVPSAAGASAQNGQ